MPINPDNGLFYPQIMMGQRDINIFPLYGEYKFAGSLTGPAFPTNSVPLLAAGYGKDGGSGGQVGGFGVAVTNTLGAGTTLTTAVTAGQVAAGSGPQISYTATVLTDTNASFTAAIVGSMIYTESGKTGTVTAQTATTLTVSSWTGGTPVAGEGYKVGPNTIAVGAVTGISVGTKIQIDTNNTSTGVTSEVRNVTNIATLTLTLDVPLFYAHLVTATVKPATAATPLFQHYFVPGNSLSSLTIEKNLGGFQSEQYSGCRVSKYQLKASTGNTPVEFTADIMGANVTVLATPTALSVVNEAPFVFAEGTLTLFGSLVQEITSIQMDIENAVKETYTFNNAHTPSYITPVSRKAVGQITLVFTSLNDPVKGYFVGTGITGSTPLAGAIDATFLHTATGAQFQMHLNKCRISKYADDIKVSDVILVTLSFEAEFDLSATPNSLGYASVINSAQWLPY